MFFKVALSYAQVSATACSIHATTLDDITTGLPRLAHPQCLQNYYI